MLRLESLEPRVVLVSDSFVGPLPESIAAPVEAHVAGVFTEAEASPEDVIAVPFNGDFNGDGHLSPIDVLLVFNAASELRAGHGISEEAFAAFDVNRDGVLANDDIDRIVAQLEPQSSSAPVDPTLRGGTS
ncbi:MAG: dockerin type I domain-containing protein, partial [Planctomycetota bacterium]